MEKILYFDCETTGTDPIKHDIIEIAGIVQIDGHVEDQFVFKVRPGNIDNISPEALQKNGYKEEEIVNWPSGHSILIKIKNVFDSYVDKYTSNDKFLPAGMNLKFDIDFLDAFFRKNGDQYGIGSYMTWQPFDIMYYAVLLKRLGIINPPNMKLESICECFGVEPGDHTALKDVEATRAVGEHIFNNIQSLSFGAMALKEIKVSGIVEKQLPAE